MQPSLIINTFNWPQALSATLNSVKNQSVLPKEVIIADDGSDKHTSTFLRDWKKKLPIPLIHSWQEDLGFRLAKSRNKAIAKSKGKYIIIIDGDLVLHPDFVKDHIKHAKENRFVVGTRTLLSKDFTEKYLKNSCLPMPKFWQTGILKNRKNALNNSSLSKLFSHNTTSYSSARGGAMALWMRDFIKVNGFNEAFEGWGREDTEIVVRLLNAGVIRKNVKFSANTYHLFHKENCRKALTKNDELLKQSIKNKWTSCKEGVNCYL